MSQQTREAWTKELTKREMHANLTTRKNKYGATKVEHEGHIFDSKKEFNRWRELELRARAGEILDLQRQVVFALLAATVLEQPVAGVVVGKYVADFVYRLAADGVTIVEDVKSPATKRLAAYRLKKKLLAANYGLEIQEV